MSADSHMTDPDTPIEAHVVDAETGREAAPEGEGPSGASGASGPSSEAPSDAEDLHPEDAGPPSDGAAEPPLPEESPPDPFEELRTERDDYLDALRRVQADFENYKKRVLRQQTEHLERAAESLVNKLLPVLDTLDLALGHADGDSEDGKALAQVGASLIDVLTKEGLDRVDPLGAPFDPAEAEAVMHEPADDAGSTPEVVEVLRAGWRWRGRVIRPAMVKVKG